MCSANRTSKLGLEGFGEEELLAGYVEQGKMARAGTEEYDVETIKNHPKVGTFSPESNPINPKDFTEEENEIRMGFIDMALGDAITTKQQQIKQIILMNFTSDVIVELQATYNVDSIFQLEENTLIHIKQQLNSKLEE